ncbi:MAG TPA: monovalent cation/H+ antiporter complex subunit F [Candidatus Binataceae bacterium]|nr:monovalent cation/H+ antiporter complex subunit F [Candidatus Binataceae bacterium]
MNIWLLAAALLQAGIVVCGIVSVRSGLLRSLVAMEMASAIAVLTVICLAEAVGRPAWFDLAVALGLLSFPSGMVFLIFLERWL